LSEAQAGAQIIRAKAGKPCARLMPLAPAPARRQPGRLEGRVTDAFFEPLPPEDLDAWEGR